MNFTLNPPSGHADSYVDIQFVIETDQAVNARVSFFNETTNDDISIIGVNSGYITENVAVFNESKSMVGFIDLFPNDKMNSGLSNKDQISIKCTIEINGKMEIMNAVFYNESQSLDAGVIPFDITLPKKDINISNHENLEMKISSNSEKLFELCIRSDENINNWCCFTVMARNGVTSVKIPSEIIYSDLNMSSNKTRTFGLYYIKPEGITYSRFMNRKFVKILDITFTFDSFTLLPVSRFGPVGELDSNFILSDRYFVHTFKDFTSLKVKNDYPTYKIANITWFFHESQDMNNAKNIISQFSASDNVAASVMSTQKEFRSSQMPSMPNYKEPIEKSRLLGIYSKNYNKQEQGTVSVMQNKTEPDQVQVFLKGKGCSSCGRKK